MLDIKSTNKGLLLPRLTPLQRTAIANVERIVARLFAVETALPAARPALRSLAATLVPTDSAGDFTQAATGVVLGGSSPGVPKCGGQGPGGWTKNPASPRQ